MATQAGETLMLQLTPHLFFWWWLTVTLYPLVTLHYSQVEIAIHLCTSILEHWLTSLACSLTSATSLRWSLGQSLGLVTQWCLPLGWAPLRYQFLGAQLVSHYMTFCMLLMQAFTSFQSADWTNLVIILTLSMADALCLTAYPVWWSLSALRTLSGSMFSLGPSALLIIPPSPPPIPIPLPHHPPTVLASTLFATPTLEKWHHCLGHTNFCTILDMTCSTHITDMSANVSTPLVPVTCASMEIRHTCQKCMRGRRQQDTLKMYL